MITEDRFKRGREVRGKINVYFILIVVFLKNFIVLDLELFYFFIIV